MSDKFKVTKKIFKEEFLFLFSGFVLGLLFIYINPPFHSNDEDRHFIHAYLISQGNILPESHDGKPGGMLPVNLVESINKYQGIPFQRGIKISRKKTEQFDKLNLNPKNRIYIIDYQYKVNPLPYLPHSIGIAIGQFINSGPIGLGYAGRIGGLIVYLILIFVAIRIAPLFKSVLILIGLMPMALYQGASVTYDMMSNGLTILLISYILYLTFSSDEKLSFKNIIFFIVITFAHRFSKDGYYLLPFLFFLLPYKKIGSPLKTGLIAAYLIILIFLPDLTWDKIISGVDASGIDLLKRDFYVNPLMNFHRALSNPLEFISLIISNFLYFKKEWIGGMIARFGYSYTMMPDWFYIFYGLVLIIVAFSDSNYKARNVKSANNALTANVEIFFQMEFKFYQKIIIFLIGFGTAFLVMVGLFLHSPVGAKMIFGLQGRYFIPALPVILLLLHNTKYNLKNYHYLSKYLCSAIAISSILYCLIALNSALYTD